MIKRSFHISRTLAATIIGFGVTALEKYVQTNLFTCPCENDDFKTVYVWMFIVIPFSALYIVGLSINQFFWKLNTGRMKNAPGLDQLKLKTKVKISPYWFALVGPIVWLVIYFADGNYLACLSTAKPYQLELNQTCNETGLQIQDLSFTLRYRQIKRWSQVGGILFGFVLAISVWIWYTCNKCRSEMNYYQEKYNSKCSDQIEVLLVEEFVQKAVQKEPRENENHLQRAIKDVHSDDSNYGKFWKHVFEEIAFGQTDFTNQSLNWIECKKNVKRAPPPAKETEEEGSRNESIEMEIFTQDDNN